MVNIAIKPKNGTIEIAVIGKYMSLQDAYKSIYEALTHAGISNEVKVKVRGVEAEDIEKNGAGKYLKGVDGILVPGGFGDRGVQGKIEAVKFARVNKVPFLGICLGMQCVVIEFARNVCGLKDANSAEFDEATKNNVIDLMEDQKSITAKGGTMRLGAYPCVVKDGTNSMEAYKAEHISERHRHRYEFNSKFSEVLEENGLVIAGTSPDGGLVEIVEVKDHPWFTACQYHPEFKSTPVEANPLFREFVKASLGNKK